MFYQRDNPPGYVETNGDRPRVIKKRCERGLKQVECLTIGMGSEGGRGFEGGVAEKEGNSKWAKPPNRSIVKGRREIRAWVSSWIRIEPVVFLVS